MTIESGKNTFKQESITKINKDEETSLEMFRSLVNSKNKEDRHLAFLWLKNFLELFKLPSQKIINAWESNAQSQSSKDKEAKDVYTKEDAFEDLMLIIKKNLLCIKRIEAKHSTICKYLYENYGIKNFGRFSQETWLDQYEEREKSKPFGLVVVSRDDWNASSYSEGACRAYDNLRIHIHPSHSLKIIEAQSLPELAKLLVSLERKYKKSPEFVVWSGHGGGEEFFLGPAKYRKENYKFFIERDDFKGVAGKRMQPYLDLFSPHTVQILDSCSSDKEENLPSVAANVTGNIFIYPKGKTQVKDFGVTRDSGGNLSFNVQYDFGIKTAVIKEKF